MIPGYHTQKELLAALGMSRQNFYQTGLAAVLRPAVTIGRSQLYRAEDVGLWRDWLRYRKARIVMGEWAADAPLLPAGGNKWPSWISDHEWNCPVCGGIAYAPDNQDDHRLYCPVDGWIARAGEPGEEERLVIEPQKEDNQPASTLVSRQR